MYLSKHLLGVEKAISAKIAILLVQVDVLKEVTEKVRQTKCDSSLVREQVLNIVADVTGKTKIGFLSTNEHVNFHLSTATEWLRIRYL